MASWGVVLTLQGGKIEFPRQLTQPQRADEDRSDR